MILSHKNQILWLDNKTIDNLDLKTWQSQICLGILLLDFISIIYKHFKNKNKKDQYFEVNIYYLALTIML